MSFVTEVVMRIFIVLFTFTVIHLRWAQDYEHNRDTGLFYTFGRQFGSLAEFHRQRRQIPWIRKTRYCDFDFPELNLLDYIRKGSSVGNKNQGSCGCGKANIERYKWVDDGEEVKPPYKYPWMIAFKRAHHEGVFCGGALITNTYILTAAHCLDRNPNSMHRGPKSQLQPWRPSELRLFHVTKTRNLQATPPVQRIIPHPGFEFINTDHDIGLVKLSKPVPYNKYTRPICLAPQGTPVPIGKIFRIAGWGVEEMSSDEGSKALLEAKIKHVPFSNCEHKFQKLLRRNYYCLKGLEGQSPCHGDSGGPMFREYDGTYYVLGVTSMHSSTDCDPDDTFIFTSVSTHIPWIKSVMGAAFPTGPSSNRASSAELWASPSTGQRGSSSFRASPFRQWATSYDWLPSIVHLPSSSNCARSTGKGAASSGDKWTSSLNWGYSTGERPSYSSWSSG